MHQKESGFTLIEMMVTVAVAAILLTVAIPSFTQMIDKKRLESAAENLYADLQFARSEAIKRNKTIRVSFYANGSTWCYGLKENVDCDCGGTDPEKLCEIDGVQKIVSSDEFKDITITKTWTDNPLSFPFAPLHGILEGITNNTIIFQSLNNKELRVVVSRFGRVRLCSPSGEGNINSYPVCPP